MRILCSQGHFVYIHSIEKQSQCEQKNMFISLHLHGFNEM